MSEWKQVKLENPDFKCRKCGGDNLEWREYDSDDHQDTYYHCPDCHYHWAVDGSDY